MSGWPIWIAGRVEFRAAPEPAPAGVDRALFETIGVGHGRPRRLEAHLDRIERAARSLGRERPDRERIASVVRSLAEALPEPSGAVRVSLLDDGRGLLGTTRPAPLLPDEGIVLWLAPPSLRARDPFESVKHADRAGKDAARAAARAAGAFDALLTNDQGEAVEATVANLWWVRSGRALTPPIHAGCLPGVLRAELLSAARSPEGLAYGVAPLALPRLSEAEELFVTNSLVGPVGVRRLVMGGQTLEFPGSQGPAVRQAARSTGFGDPARDPAAGI